MPQGSSSLLNGMAVSPGIARGAAFVCHCAEEPTAPRHTIAEAEVERELARLDRAVLAAEAEFANLRGGLERRGEDEALQILDAEAGLLRDPMLYDAARERCRRERINAEAAVLDVTEELARVFGGIGDALIRERISDVRDVSRRVLCHLTGSTTEPDDPPPGCILVTRELPPSVAIHIDRRQIRGVITEQGAVTAHAIILARSAGVPTVIHVADAVRQITTGDRLIVDGIAGRVFVNPGPDVEREYDRVEAARTARQRQLRELIDLPAVTRDGTKIALNANVGLVADAEAAATEGADGVGLYRTEFVFFAQDHLPSEEEQLSFYRKSADCLRGRRLVVRALDLGSDKLLPYLPLPIEPNPSLGRRGMRLLLAQQEILLTQLRAILRLSASTTAALLFPMVGSIEELVEAKKLVELARQQLAVRKLDYDPRLPIGAMIETPAAAVLARHIAREVDFLSVGTNDLVQYLLATDRTNPDLAAFYEPLHPAVILTLKSVFDAAAAEGKEVSLCGEIAGNPAYTRLLLGLGARSLSVAPGEILEIKRIIRSTTLTAAQKLARRALASRTIREVKDALSVSHHVSARLRVDRV